MRPTEVLITEHNAVLIALQILEKVEDKLALDGANAFEHMDQLVDFFGGFVDRCHHAKEEDVLFPELLRRGLPREGGPIAVMLAEHDAGRRHIREMSIHLALLMSGDKNSLHGVRESSSAYRDLLRAHIDKENNVLFPMADRLIPGDEAAKIIEQFEEIERDRVGAGRHEAYHGMLHHLKEAYKV